MLDVGPKTQLKDILIKYFHGICPETVSVPYLNPSQNCQKFLKKDSDRAIFTLSENMFSSNFSRLVLRILTQKFSQSTLRFGNGEKFVESTEALKMFLHISQIP